MISYSDHFDCYMRPRAYNTPVNGAKLSCLLAKMAVIQGTWVMRSPLTEKKLFAVLFNGQSLNRDGLNNFLLLS